jgi:AraC-like DNA-binding protein
MRSLSDVDRQISENFRVRLAEVLADEPQSKVRAALASIESEYGLNAVHGAESGLPLHDLLHGLNEPEWFPGIAVRFGLARQILDLGLIGYTALSCGDIGAALNVIYRYHALTSDAYQVLMAEEDDRVVVRLWVRPSHGSHRVVIGEEFATGFWQVLSELLPPTEDLGRARLAFAYPAPEYATQYYELMPSHISFDTGTTSVTIPSAWRDLRLKTADATVQQVCLAQCDQLMTGLAPGQRITDDVRRMILSVPSNRPIRLKDVARAMLTSPRTLERRLHKAGTSFRSIDLEVRMELAAQYLTLGSLSGQEIANVLGYSRPSAFFRAFKAWFGLTPGQFRASDTT